MGMWKHVTFQAHNSYKDPRDLWDKATEYFEYCDETPILEVKLVPRRNGRPFKEKVKHPRAYTFNGLLVFLGISSHTYAKYRLDERFSEVCAIIDSVIYTQKFEFAAVDLMNANLIARDLKLSDRQEITGADGGPLNVVKEDAEAFAGRIAGLAARKAEG